MLKKLLSKFTPRTSYYYYVDGNTIALRDNSSNTVLTVQNCTDLDILNLKNTKLKSLDFEINTSCESICTITLDTESIKFCAKAMAKCNDVRYYLAGLFLNLNTGGMVASDGHRLHAVKMWDVRESSEERIIPAFFINKLLDIAKIYKLDSLALAISKNSIKFSISNITLTSDFIGRVYPDMSRVRPENAPEVGQFTAFDAPALKMLNLVTKKVPPYIIFESGIMSVKDAPQNNHFIENLPSCFSKSLKRYCYDVDYIADFNRELDGGTVQEDNGKLLIKKGEYLTVLMPVRV